MIGCSLWVNIRPGRWSGGNLDIMNINWNKSIAVIGPVVCIIAASGCRPERNLSESVEAARSKVATRSGERVDSPVVATIGDREIRFDEVVGNLDSLPVFVRMRYKSPERRLEFLEAYVEFQVLALAAAAEGLGSDPKVVDVLKRDLASRYLIENFDLKQRTTDISEDVIREFYDSHPWVFSHPAQNHVFRILCSDRTQAAKVAYRVRSLVESATGDPLDVFREHVARSSVDPAAFRTSGDIGIYPSAGGSSASVPVQVAAAAEALDTLHQVSDPVEAPDGWSVLFLARQIPPVSKDIDQARAEIAGMILDARRLEARRALADSLIRPLKESGSLVVNHELLSDLAAADIAARKSPGPEKSR